MSFRRRALLVGINDYRNYNNLKNAQNDAKEIAGLLEFNEPQRKGKRKRKNYTVTLLEGTAANSVTKKLLADEISTLFNSGQDHLLFYFAGHAVRSELLKDSYLVTWDGDDASPGIPMNLILASANEALEKRRTSSCTIILDCCHAGAVNNMQLLPQLSISSRGITILSACDSNQLARDQGSRPNHGAFTSLLLDGLEGQAADLLGRVTPGSIYALVDARMGGAPQRPMINAYVSEFVVLRKSEPQIALEDIEVLVDVFGELNSEYKLLPDDEENSALGNYNECFGNDTRSFHEERHQVYRSLQACFKNGLVEPVRPEEKPKHWDCMTRDPIKKKSIKWPPKNSGGFSMWHAALFSAPVKLTSKGKSYWNLAKEGRLEEG